MAQESKSIVSFNRGRISALGLARIDLKRYPFSAEIQTNWMPRALGSMMFRPGLGYIDDTLNDQQAFHVPFIFSLTDTALLEMTNQAMRIRIADQILTRPAITTAITNPNFSVDLSGWVQNDEAGTLSSWSNFNGGTYMALIGTGTNRAIRSQNVTVSTDSQNVEHGLRMVVARGYVVLRVGTVYGDDSYVKTTTLGPGTHSLSFVPTGNFTIEVTAALAYTSLVASINLDVAGPVVLPTPYLTADLPLLRTDQSADVVFMACNMQGSRIGYPQYKVERRTTRSWSIVLYTADDGPFLLQNIDNSISMTAGALTGDTQLTSSIPYFRAGHAGALFSLQSIGQFVINGVAGANQYSNPVKITGVGNSRNMGITVSGSFSGTITLQRSVGDIGAWSDVSGFSYTGATNTSYNDTFDNQTIYYRLGFDAGNYSSGTAMVGLSNPSGSILGICRVNAVYSPTQVGISILRAFGSTQPTSNWSEGQWSQVRGYPTSVALNEGRLWFAGRDKIIGSVSDAFASFDATVLGDSGPINRSIGSGPVDSIAWLLPLLRFAMGGGLAEYFIFSDALDAPLTPTNNNIRAPSNKGAATVQAVKLANQGIFVDKSGTRVYTVAYDNLYQQYPNEELTVFCPEIGLPGIVRLALQQQPDVRLHALRSDGTVAVLVYDKTEDVQCWIDVQSPGASGFIEDIVVLPGLVEDQVYYCVRRTVNGVTRRFLEKWALESQCVGGTVSLNLDSFTTFNNGAPANTIGGLGHLEGQQVVVWADGTDLSPMVVTGKFPNMVYTPTTYTVMGGVVTLPAGKTVTQGAVGLFYSASYRSTKLSYASSAGTAIAQVKLNDLLGLVLNNAHLKGIMFGDSLTTLQEMPNVEDGTTVPANQVWTQYDKEMHAFDSQWGPDPRICLFAAAPRPVTVLGMVVSLETNDET